jgi:hypothetical protein
VPPAPGFPPPPQQPPAQTPQPQGSAPVYAPSGHNGWSKLRFAMNRTYPYQVRNSQQVTRRVLSGLLGFSKVR